MVAGLLFVRLSHYERLGPLRAADSVAALVVAGLLLPVFKMSGAISRRGV